MAQTHVIHARHIICAKLKSEWEQLVNANLVPLQGEFCLEINDTELAKQEPDINEVFKLKIGDGSSKYSELPYLFTTKTEINTLIDAKINALDVAAYAQASYNSTTKVLTISGIKEVDGKVSADSSTNVTVDLSPGSIAPIQTIVGDNTWVQVTTDANDNTKRIISHIGPDTNNTSSATATAGTAPGWTGNVLTGVTIDTKGHVTGVTTGALPSNPNVTSEIVVSNSSSGTTNAASSDSPYLNHIEGGSVSSSHRIIGDNKINVSSSANGNITINHTTAERGDGIKLVEGGRLDFGDDVIVDITVDEWGHAIDATTKTLPSNPVSALSSHSEEDTDKGVKVKVTTGAGSVTGVDVTVTPANVVAGGVIDAGIAVTNPWISKNTNQNTGVVTLAHTDPSTKNTTLSRDANGADVITSVEVDDKGHTRTQPGVKTIAGGTKLSVGSDSSNITVSHDATTRSNTDNTTNLAFGASVVTAVETDTTGHVTGTTTYKLPTDPTVIANHTENDTDKGITVTVGTTNAQVSSVDVSVNTTDLAQELGLSGAMHLIGESTTVITEGGHESPTIDGTVVSTIHSGDVVLYNNLEFVWVEDSSTYGGHWVKYGDEGSYALKTRSISAGSELTGGGTLEADRTINHAEKLGSTKANSYGPTQTSATTLTNGTTFKVPKYTVNAYGHITDTSEITFTASDHTYTVNDGDLTIQGSGTTAATFNANDANDVNLNIVGNGATTVTAGTNQITISSTDQTVDSAAHHYSPSTDSSSTIDLNASGATAAANLDVVTGVTLTRDSKGHVTGLTIDSGKVPTFPVQDVKVNGSTVVTSNEANIVTDGTYHASNNKIATESTVSTAVTNAINDLDVNVNQATIAADTDSNSKTIIKVTGVKETNGKIVTGDATSVVVEGGNMLTTSVSSNTLTIDHDAVTTTVTDASTPVSEKDSYVITDVTTDSYGHVTAYTKDKSTNLIAADIKEPIREVDNSSVWNYRITGGDISIGEDTAKVIQLKGNTLKWNQQIGINSYSPWGGAKYSRSSSGDDYILTVNDVSADNFSVYNETVIPKINDSTYIYVSVDIKASRNLNYFYFQGGGNTSGSDNGEYFTIETSYKRFSGICQVFNREIDENRTFILLRCSIATHLSIGDTIYIKKLNVVNLEQLFASYANVCTILGVENLTSIENKRLAIQNFKKLFPLDYYDYTSTPVLINNISSGIKTTGFNQFDESTLQLGKWRAPDGTEEDGTGRRRSDVYFPCFPSTDYYLYSSNTTNNFCVVICWYDSNKQYISGTKRDTPVVPSPSNAAYFRISSVFGSPNICINIHSSKDGTYEPYEEHTLYFNGENGSLATITGRLLNNGAPTGNSVTIFPEGMKSAGSVYDFGKADNDGYIRKVTKVFHKVLLENLAWSRELEYWSTKKSNMNPSMKSSGYFISNKYGLGTGDNQIIQTASYLRVYASESPTGILYYQMDTPEEYLLDTPIPATYVVNDIGTEQQLPINTSTPTNAPFTGDFEYYSNFKDAVRDALEKVNNYKNPVRGIDDTPQTTGKLAVYDSINTTKSSTFTASNDAISASGTDNTTTLPTVNAIINYVGSQASVQSILTHDDNDEDVSGNYGIRVTHDSTTYYVDHASVIQDDTTHIITPDSQDATIETAAEGIVDVVTNVSVDDFGHVTGKETISSDMLIAADIKAPVIQKDETSWRYRQTGGDITIGEDVAKIKSLKGNIVKWNQLSKVTESAFPVTVSNIRYTYNSTTGIITANGTVSGAISVLRSAYLSTIPINKGHKYLIGKMLSTGGETNNNISIQVYYYTDTQHSASEQVMFYMTDVNGYSILEIPSDYPLEGESLVVRPHIRIGASVTDAKFQINVFDLTEMFGSGNEPSIEEFNKLYPNDYYPYCECRYIGLGGYPVYWNQLYNGEQPPQTVADHQYYTSELNSGVKNTAIQNNNLTWTADSTSRMCVDITQMYGYGSTITKGELDALLPNDYYEYNAGEWINILDLKDNNNFGIKSIGVNQWDEELDNGYGYNQTTGVREANAAVLSSRNKIRVVPGETYCIKKPNQELRLFRYSIDGVYLGTESVSASTKTYDVPLDTCYITFQLANSVYGTKYKYDICISRSNPTTDDKYFPYQSDTLDLDFIRNIEYTPSGSTTPEKLFPYGMFKYDDNIYDEVTETKAIKRISVIDLGTIPFAYNSQYNIFSAPTSSNIPNLLLPTSISEVAKIFTTVYKPVSSNQITAIDNSINIQHSGLGRVRIHDNTLASTDTSTVSHYIPKLKNILLYYVLATPIEVDLIPAKKFSYIVSDTGTEQQLPSDIRNVSPWSAPFAGTFVYESNFKNAVLNLLEIEGGRAINIDKNYVVSAEIVDDIHGSTDNNKLISAAQAWVEYAKRNVAADIVSSINNNTIVVTSNTITGTAAPSVTPDRIGQQFIDTTNRKVYVAVGTSASTDWVLIGQ